MARYVLLVMTHDEDGEQADEEQVEKLCYELNALDIHTENGSVQFEPLSTEFSC